MKGAFFSAALLAALVFPACQDYDYTMDTEETAKPQSTLYDFLYTDPSKFRIAENEYLFPAGTHVYEIVRTLGIRNQDKGNDSYLFVDENSDISEFHYFREPATYSDSIKETITLSFQGESEKHIYSFVFDSQKGVLCDDVLQCGIKATLKFVSDSSSEYLPNSTIKVVWCFKII